MLDYMDFPWSDAVGPWGVCSNAQRCSFKVTQCSKESAPLLPGTSASQRQQAFREASPAPTSLMLSSCLGLLGREGVTTAKRKNKPVLKKKPTSSSSSKPRLLLPTSAMFTVTNADSSMALICQLCGQIYVLLLVHLCPAQPPRSSG